MGTRTTIHHGNQRWLLHGAMRTLARVLALYAGIHALYCQPLPLKPTHRVVDSLLQQLPTTLRSPDTTLTNLLNDIAYEYWQLNLDSSALFTHKALQNAQAQNFVRGEAAAWESFGRIASTQGNYDSAHIYHHKALTIYERIGWQPGIANALNSLGVVYRLQSKYAEALDSYNRALGILHKHPTTPSNQRILTRLLNNVAMVYRLQGRYSDALPHLQEALTIRRHLNDKAGVAGLQRNIGLLYAEQHQHEQALQWYNEALSTYAVLGDQQGIAASSDNIGMSYQAQQRFDSAEASHRRALGIFQTLGNKQGEASALYNLAKIASAQGSATLSLGYHQQALRLRQTMGDKEAIAASRIGLGQALARLQRHNEALEQFEQAVQLAIAIGARTDAAEAWAGLAESYERTGKTASALEALKSLLQMRDTLFTEQNSRTLMQLQAQHYNERQQERIRLLEQAQQMQVLDSERQRNIRNFAFALVGLASLAAAAAWYGYRTKRRAAELLQRRHQEIMRQQKILEEQAVEIELANSELQHKNLLLEQLNNEKNEFLGIVAHDLKNPLNNVTMALSLVQNYWREMNLDDVMVRLRTAQNAALRMKAIITNLLDLNAIESGKFPFSPKLLGVQALVNEIVHDYRDRATEKEITINVAFAQDSTQVFADVTALQEIVDNLLSNAIKYSPFHTTVLVKVSAVLPSRNQEQTLQFIEHGVEGKEHLLHSVQGPSWALQYSSLPFPSVRIAFQDEGPGLTESDKRRLFEKFARLSAQPTGGEHSTGLGLSIVKKMVEAMNGRVWCESELGNGATFVVELPAQQ
jgi:signal transduction histidine kinase